MPIFEFTCNACGEKQRKFPILVGVVANAAPPACPRCGGNDLKKVVSRFARVRSDDDALDSLADRADQTDMDDPRAMRHLMKEMAGEMGEDADDFEQMMEEAGDEEMGADDAGSDDLLGGSGDA